MSRNRVTKEISFEKAHLLHGYDGPCSQIHGHSYRLFVTVVGTPSDDPNDPKYGMVIDFGVLKRIVGGNIVDVFDHSLLVHKTPGKDQLIAFLEPRFPKLHVVGFQPTCENLVTHFAHIISSQLPQSVSLFSLRLHETATSYAEWFASDNP